MFKKVSSAFFALLILISLLVSCSKKAEAPAPALNTETPAGISTPAPLPSISTVTPASPSGTGTPSPSNKTNSTSSEKNLITKDVYLSLSSPELKGRVMGSAGAEKAQSIIQSLFGKLNLKPFSKDYISPVFRDPFRKSSPSPSSKGDGFNVIGFLDGKKSEECLIISAHYDGAENGTSALDNAAGVYGLLRIAEKLANYSKNHILARDIIFAAFDGEEAGLIGSSYLADQIREQYEKAIVINFDCIGIKNSDSYMVAGNQAQFTSLVDSLYQQLKAYDFKTVPADSTLGSDHLPFEWEGIPAVTIGEKDVTGIVHTSSDTADKVDINEIERVSEAVYSYVLKQADGQYKTLFSW